MPFPSADESMGRLRRAGWSVGDVGFGPSRAVIWMVAGTNGENRLRATGRSQAEAWWGACLQAREVGMLAKAM